MVGITEEEKQLFFTHFPQNTKYMSLLTCYFAVNNGHTLELRIDLFGDNEVAIPYESLDNPFITHLICKNAEDDYRIMSTHDMQTHLLSNNIPMVNEDDIHYLS